MKRTFYILPTPYPYPVYEKINKCKNKLKEPFTYLITSNFFQCIFHAIKRKRIVMFQRKLKEKLGKLKIQKHQD